MVLEQNPLLAAADSGEDSMVDVCAREITARPRKGRKRPRIKIGALEHFSAS